MFMRAFVIRFVFIGILVVGVALGAALRQPAVHAAPPHAGAKQAAAVAPAPLPIVTLSTVHVRADAARTVAKPVVPVRVEAAADLTSSVASDHHGAGLGPTLRLDMPYYSFGKLLPRVGKE